MFTRFLSPALALFAASSLGLTGSALAEGRATPWQMGMQAPASDTMARITSFHDLLLIIITIITIFVLVLLLWVMFRYREKANPTPSKTTHNTLVEVAWTVVPIMILVLIAVPSFRLLYFGDRVPEASAREKGSTVMTIKAIGSRFQWKYQYFTDKAGNGFEFDSNMVCETDEACKEAASDYGGKVPVRLLDVDNRVVVPVGTYVRLQVTATDVIHSFAVPAFGVKLDAVPGRLNETWFRATKTGVFYGMCSELCGPRHGYMPIAVEVLSKEKYQEWLSKAGSEFDKIEAAAPVKPKKHAAAQPGRAAKAARN